MVHLQQQAGFVLRYDPYTIDIDQKRNCYSCGGFGYLAKNYRNWGIIGLERLKYEDNLNLANNLNGKESLIVLNQALIITIDLQCLVK